VRDIFIVLFLIGLLGLGARRPFLFTLAYIYVDSVSPHRISYYLLNSIPLSMIVAVLAIGGWLLLDGKKGLRVTFFQCLVVSLILYAGWTTQNAVAPLPAQEKWDWAWKSLLFAAFLPFAVRTRLRVEASLLFLILSAGVIIISAGLKTVAGGGGYGRLNLMVDSNSGLYEGSTISAIAIALIPIILWFLRHGTIFPPDQRVRMFGAALIFACLLIPIGTEARTGLVCIAVLAVLMLRDVKRRFLYLGLVAFAGLLATPMLPASFQERMGLIQGHEQDSSAASRLAVWKWTIDFAREHPTGGGFAAYHINKLEVQTTQVVEEGGVRSVVSQKLIDEGRAWHSAYFEMLGEQGYPGLLILLLIHGSVLLKMEMIRRRYFRADGDKAWIAPLATALQHFQIVYLVGAVFVAIALTPFILLMLGVQTGFILVVRRRELAERGNRAWGRPATAPHPVEQPA
jgi:probable O-glycosylation ligase (exosortase A-associated)